MSDGVLLWRERDRHFSMPTIDTKEGLLLKLTELFMFVWNSENGCVVHSFDIKASGFIFTICEFCILNILIQAQIFCRMDMAMQLS